MAKDAYWFKHDSNSGRGLRIKKIQHIYGHWGKGVYWDIIEVLREQENYSFESDESSLNMLSELIGLSDYVKFKNWFRDCLKLNLFIEENGRFYSEVLCENMKNWDTKKINGIKGGRPKKTEINNYENLNRNLNESETLKKQKPKQNHKRREEKRIKQNNEVFYCQKYKIEYEIINGEKIYGNLRDRKSGGLSEFGLKQHCEKNNIAYEQ